MNVYRIATLLFLVGAFAQLTTAQVKGFSGCAQGTERVEVLDESYEQQILSLVNAERKKRGLLPLEMSATLAAAARYHAKDMALDDYFDHITHDRVGKTLQKRCTTFERVKKFTKSTYGYLAENIAAGPSTPKAIVDMWMKSPGHKANILSKTYKYLGVGYYSNDNSEYVHYWVQDFGK